MRGLCTVAKYCVWLCVAWLTVGTAQAYTTCVDGVAVDEHLKWARDSLDPSNEGAGCGIAVLATIPSFDTTDASLPRTAGNTLSRKAMMNAAIDALSAGYRNAAIDVASCAVFHKPTAYYCLRQHRGEVEKWLLENGGAPKD